MKNFQKNDIPQGVLVGYCKADRMTRWPALESRPFPLVTAQGVAADGEYVLCMVGNGQRQKEIERLMVVKGISWARAVKRWVLENWEQRDAVRARNPRYSLDEGLEIINAAFNQE